MSEKSDHCMTVLYSDPGLTERAAFTWGFALGARCVVIALTDAANVVWISHVPDCGFRAAEDLLSLEVHCHHLRAYSF